MAGESDLTPADGVIVHLPPASGASGQWWRVEGGTLSAAYAFDPEEPAPWGELADDARVTVLVPAAQAPVTGRSFPDMSLPQAIATERVERAGTGLGPASRFVAVAADGDQLLSCAVATADIEAWLDACAALGLDADSLVPAALVLPRPAEGVAGALLGAEPLARTSTAAFAGEPALVEALGGEGEESEVSGKALAAALLAVHAAPPLNLRQGAYAPRRASWFALPDWRRLARMAALVALLALVLMVAGIVKRNADSSAQEAAALAAAQKRFPGATDMDSAERLASAELAKRGLGGTGFAAPAAAVLSAMRPIPSLALRDLGYSSDGTLRFTAAAPRVEDVNALLIALQSQGWKVTVPPALAPDPTGATVAAITVRAP